MQVENASHPNLHKSDAMTVGCRDIRGVALFALLPGDDPDDAPRWGAYAFRWYCKNRLCCPRREGFIPTHTFYIDGDRKGQLETEYMKLRPIEEIARNL